MHKSVHAANVPGGLAQTPGRSSAGVARVLAPRAALPRENDSMTTLRPRGPPPTPPARLLRGWPARGWGGAPHDTDWPAFVFITTDDGAGWVPERYLDTSSDPAVVVTAYDTTELATAVGEELTLLERDDPSGWALVRNAEGRKGWVPQSTVEPVPEQ